MIFKIFYQIFCHNQFNSIFKPSALISLTKTLKETNVSLKEIAEGEDLYYNKISGTNFIPTDFRRNVITKGISLNKLIGKEILIGEVRLKIHDLCEPCRYLQELLGEKNLVKKLLNRGGLRCELLTNGNINVNDPIKIL